MAIQIANFTDRSGVERTEIGMAAYPNNDRGLGVKLVTGNCKGIWWVDKEFLNFIHNNPQKQDLTSEEG